MSTINTPPFLFSMTYDSSIASFVSRQAQSLRVSVHIDCPQASMSKCTQSAAGPWWKYDMTIPSIVGHGNNCVKDFSRSLGQVTVSSHRCKTFLSYPQLKKFIRSVKKRRKRRIPTRRPAGTGRATEQRHRIGLDAHTHVVVVRMSASASFERGLNEPSNFSGLL